MSVKVDY